MTKHDLYQAVEQLERLDKNILQALADPEQDLPEEALVQRAGMLEHLFAGSPGIALREPLQQAIARHRKIEQLARDRQRLLGEAREQLHFNHRAVNAYIDNQP
jgi:Zn-dependent M32 family carboxypeptidase